MKNPLGALKSFDYGKFLISHGEKLALGFAGVLVLYVLAFGTRWSRHDGDPKTLEQRAKEAEQRIATAEWPDSERLAFLATTQGAAAPQNRVDTFLEDLSLTDPRFAWDKQSPLTWKPIPEAPVIREPEWFALIDPIADSGRIVIDVPIAGESGGAMDDEAEGMGPSSEEEERTLAARSPFDRRAGGDGMSSSEFGAPGDDGGGDFGYRPGAGLGSLSGYTSSWDEGSGEEAYPEDGYDSMGGETGVPSGLPTHYVSVRMLFPARDQLKAILKARGQAMGTDSEALMEILDFEIERQQTVAGPQKWSKWEKFELDSTLRLMDLVSGFDAEVLAPSVIDTTIAMPLPVPKYGYWGPDAAHATHPKLKKYRLDAKTRAALSVAEGQLASMYSQMSSSSGEGFPGLDFGPGEGRSSMDGELRPEKKGWSTKLQSFREVASGVLETREKAAEAYQAIQDKLKEEFGPGATSLNLQQLTSMGEYFLFRFVDFDLEPGRAYRYRARLTLYNPNFDLPLDRVAHPSIVENDTRVTDWSPPTAPVVIEKDLEYFVERTQEGNATRSDNATLNVHLWSEGLGTWVAQNIVVEPGQPVGGTKAVSTEIVDLVNNRMERAPVRLETEDLLADVMTMPSLDGGDEFHGKYLSIPRGGIDIRTPAIVLTEQGELVSLDPAEREAEHLVAEDRVERQLEGFAYLSAPAADAELDPLSMGLEGCGGGAMGGAIQYNPYGDYDLEGGGAPQLTRRRRPKRTNPLRLGGGSDAPMQRNAAPTAPPRGRTPVVPRGGGGGGAGGC